MQPHPRLVLRLVSLIIFYCPTTVNDPYQLLCTCKMAVEGQTLLPGDWVAVPQSCRLGPGLYNEPTDSSEPGEDSDVRACMAGVLSKRETRTVRKGGEGEGPMKKMAWIDYSSRRVRESFLSRDDATVACSIMVTSIQTLFCLIIMIIMPPAKCMGIHPYVQQSLY